MVCAHHNVHISSTIPLFFVDFLYSHAPAVCRIFNKTDLHLQLSILGFWFIFRSQLEKFIAADCCCDYSAHDKQNLECNCTTGAPGLYLKTKMIPFLYGVTEGPLNCCYL